MAEDPYKLPHPSPVKQIVLALLIGGAVAGLVYGVAWRMATPDKAVGTVQIQNAYKFVYYVAALAGGIAFAITMTIYKKWADKQYAKSLAPAAARVVSDKSDTSS